MTLQKKLAYTIQFGLTWLEHKNIARNLLYVPYFLKYYIAPFLEYFPIFISK